MTTTRVEKQLNDTYELTRKLKTIQKGMEEKDNFPIFFILLDELYESILDFTFKYRYQYTKTGLHEEAYKAYGKKMKSKALADIQDITTELRTVNPNYQYINNKINNLIRTNFYSNDVQKKAKQFQSTNIRLIPIESTFSVRKVGNR